MTGKQAKGWLAALSGTKLEVRSARDALQIKGYLDTGNYALNWALSNRLRGGYPLGHTTELFGDPATGKSFLAARAMAMAQRSGGVAMLDDSERAYNIEHSERVGINVDDLAVTQSDTVDDHLAAVKGFIAAYKVTKPKGPGICVLDSLAQLSTKHEMEVGLDKRDMTKASELKAFYRLVLGQLSELPVMHLATNHKIAGLGMFQEATTPGGGGSKFISSVRIDMRAVSKIKKNGEVIGTLCRAVICKNRFTSPWREVRLAIPFETPISAASGLIPLLQYLGVLEKRGEFLSYKGEKVGRAYAPKNKDKFIEQDDLAESLLDQYPEILDETDLALEEGRTTRVVETDDAEEVEA